MGKRKGWVRYKGYSEKEFLENMNNNGEELEEPAKFTDLVTVTGTTEIFAFDPQNSVKTDLTQQSPFNDLVKACLNNGEAITFLNLARDESKIDANFIPWKPVKIQKTGLSKLLSHANNDYNDMYSDDYDAMRMPVTQSYIDGYAKGVLAAKRTRKRRKRRKRRG